MNKIMFIATRVAIVGILFAASASCSFAKGDKSVYTDVSPNILKERIENLPSEVDLRYTPEVHGIINTYIKKYRRSTQRLLGLSEHFFPLYEAEFSKQGLPVELKYLSIVESGLRPKVVSVSGAVGLWQFMKGTGKLYGLRINNVVDERRDPIRSTQAASRYLKDLYVDFDDWTLALAAYNCGPGNVRKSMKRSNEVEFWSMKGRGYLPKETRRYIPKYVASSYLMNYSDIHNLIPEHTKELNTLATVKVYDYTTFSKISKITGLSRSVISEYNPAFLKGYIPRSSKGYYLTLPQDDLFYYLSQVGGFENLLDLGYDSSKLKGRYMLFGAMKSRVADLSLLPKPSMLSEVTTLKPNPINSPLAITVKKEVPVLSERKKVKTHQLRPEESLLDISDKYNIKLSTLIEINEIDVQSPPPPGAEIRLE